MKKQVISAVILALSVLTLTGCTNPRSRKQETGYRQQGINYMTTGEYEKAAEAFENALNQASDLGTMEIDICFYKAEALYLSGDSDGAMEVYTSLIDLNDNIDAHYLRGNLYYALGEYEKGMEDFEIAMDARKDDYDLLIGICETLNKYGQVEDAQKVLDNILQMKGDSAKACLQKGRAYLLLGDFENAETNLKNALDKGEKKANFYLAQLYANGGSEEMADSYFNDYLESGKSDAETLMQMGEAYAKGGDYAQALKYFLGAADLDTSSVEQELMKDTIIAYEYTGDFNSAETLMEEYLAAYPTDYDAEEELTFLKTRVTENNTDQSTGSGENEADSDSDENEAEAGSDDASSGQ